MPNFDGNWSRPVVLEWMSRGWAPRSSLFFWLLEDRNHQPRRRTAPIFAGTVWGLMPNRPNQAVLNTRRSLSICFWSLILLFAWLYSQFWKFFLMYSRAERLTLCGRNDWRFDGYIVLDFTLRQDCSGSGVLAVWGTFDVAYILEWVVIVKLVKREWTRVNELNKWNRWSGFTEELVEGSAARNYH